MPGDINTVPFFDRLKAAIFKLIMAAIGDRLPYLGVYPGVVLSQSGQKVDVQPDDNVTWPSGWKGIPLRYGTPQTSVTVANGSRVLVAFENGDPARPYAALWDTSTLSSMTIGPSGAPAAARNGDPVNIGSWTAASATLTISTPDGGVQSFVFTCAVSGAVGTITIAPTGSTGAGKISGGSSKVNIG